MDGERIRGTLGDVKKLASLAFSYPDEDFPEIRGRGPVKGCSCLVRRRRGECSLHPVVREIFFVRLHHGGGSTGTYGRREGSNVRGCSSCLVLRRRGARGLRLVVVREVFIRRGSGGSNGVYPRPDGINVLAVLREVIVRRGGGASTVVY